MRFNPVEKNLERHGRFALRRGHWPGVAVIQDMSHEATHAAIEREVEQMRLGRVNSFATKATLEMLKRRAYSPAHLAQLAALSPFGNSEIKTEGIGLEVRLVKEAVA